MTSNRNIANLASQSLATDSEVSAAVSAAVANKASYVYASTAPASPSNGDLWMDTTTASPKGKVWNGSEWKLFSGAGAANFSNTATGTYSSDGDNYKYITFTGSGTLTVTTAGFADILLVGGGGGSGAGTDGGGGERSGSSGGGGSVFYGTITVEAGSYTITVGGGGNAGAFSGGNGGAGGTSSIALPNTFVRLPSISSSGGGGGGGNAGAVGAQGNSHPNTGTTLSFTGSSVIYGKGQSVVNGTAAPSNLGQAGGSVGAYQAGRVGGSGVVIVRVKV